MRREMNAEGFLQPASTADHFTPAYFGTCTMKRIHQLSGASSEVKLSPPANIAMLLA